MDNWIIAMTIVLMANFVMMTIVLLKIGGFEKTLQWEWIFVNFVLLFKRKIIVRPQIQHYSPHQRTQQFYVAKTYKCSHERFFKLISGTYTTIVPESEILEIIDNHSTKKTWQIGK